MIIHLFNSSVVSGPETLVIPALKNLGEKVAVVFITETRLEEASKGPVKYARDLGHEVHTVNVRSRFDRQTFKDLRDLLDRLNPRIVHAHDVKASFYLLGAKKNRSGFKPKIISTHHGTLARKGLTRVYEEIYVRLILPKFDATVAVSEHDRISLLSRGIKKEKLFVHLNGVDRLNISPERKSEVSKEIRARWMQTYPYLPRDLQEYALVGAVARLSWEKRHDRMINAAAEMKKISPDYKFAMLFFGIGGDEVKLKEQARALGVEDRVYFIGYSKTIGQEMAGLDLVLCLSDGEGIPINLIEAGWSSTAVFSTKVGGIPDLLESDKYSFMVEKEETDQAIGVKLLVALKDKSKCAEVARNYHDRIVSKFSEKAWLDQLRSVYSKM